MPDRKVREPNREEFSLDEDGLRVTHDPTGATFSTYRYEDPEDTANQLNITWGRVGERFSYVFFCQLGGMFT